MNFKLFERYGLGAEPDHCPMVEVLQSQELTAK